MATISLKVTPDPTTVQKAAEDAAATIVDSTFMERYNRTTGALMTALIGRVVLSRLPVHARVVRFFTPTVLSAGIVSVGVAPCSASALGDVRTQFGHVRSSLPTKPSAFSADWFKVGLFYFIAGAESAGVLFGKVTRAIDSILPDVE